MIPRIIHQTYKTSDNLPWFFNKGQDSVKKHMPEWEYRFWTDDDLDVFVQRHYPRFYQQWLALDKDVKRWDTARYMLLHHFGGMYADLDFVFKKPVDDLFDDEHKLYFYVSTQAQVKRWSFLGNAWMAAKPGQQFWIDLLKWIFECNSNVDVLNHTGPRALGMFFNKMCLKDKDAFDFVGAKIFSPDIFDNEKCQDGVGKASYGFHMRTGTWQHHALPQPATV